MWKKWSKAITAIRSQKITKIKTFEHKNERKECAGTKTHNVIVVSTSPQQTLNFDTAEKKKKKSQGKNDSKATKLSSRGKRTREDEKSGAEILKEDSGSPIRAQVKTKPGKQH